MILSEMFILEYTDEDRKEVAAAKRKLRQDEKELLLQVQLMSFNTLIDDIIKKVPSAKWMPFKKADNYKGKISYEVNGGYAELWFRSDGMVVCSTTVDPRKVKCESDEKIFNWIEQHPAAIDETEDEKLTGDMIDEIAAKINAVFISEKIEKFKKQTKVIGKQAVYHHGQRDYFDLWYRPSGEVFCKTPDGRFYSFDTLHKLERFLIAVCQKRENKQ